jgi:hypothetical protein
MFELTGEYYRPIRNGLVANSEDRRFGLTIGLVNNMVNAIVIFYRRPLSIFFEANDWA